MDLLLIIIGAVLMIIVIVLLAHIRIVPQSKAYVVERLGAYNATWNTGIHVLLPILDHIAAKVSLKEKMTDFEPQAVITRDNATVRIDTVVFYQITDPKLYIYGAEDPEGSIEKLSVTSLRNIIGELELDTTLTSRDTINAKIRLVLDEATDPWGIKITRAELKNIDPPDDIKDAMTKQMTAERERRAAILEAEGRKASEILVAEGEKQAAILKAEAQKEAQIRMSEGEAEALMKVTEAKAQAIQLINENLPSEEYLTLQKIAALEKVSDGKATKIIIPTEIASVAGLASAVVEAATKTDDNN